LSPTEEGQKRATILVVDDEQTIREVLSRTLEDGGYVCETAANADEASAKFEQHPADLVLSDVMMPGRSGLELLEEIKQISPDTAVIMVTAVADAQTAINALKVGAYDYVTKPFNLTEVIMSVDRALEKRSLVIANREYHEQLEQKVDEQTAEIRNTFLGAVKALAEALEAKDPYTNGHSKRVTEISITLAREMGVGEELMDRIRLAGMVHDIGKIGIPEEILHKPERLTKDEYELIKSHSAIGEKILRPVIKDQEVLQIVRCHHEMYGGGGYPEGLEKSDIPLGARIMAVADAYDAMTSNRPYRQALPTDRAKAILVANRGGQFDPEIVDIFMRCEDKMPFCPLSAAPEMQPAEGWSPSPPSRLGGRHPLSP
jgi:putative nucleotidyltransferase with HDIG domain